MNGLVLSLVYEARTIDVPGETRAYIRWGCVIPEIGEYCAISELLSISG